MRIQREILFLNGIRSHMRESASALDFTAQQAFGKTKKAAELLLDRKYSPEQTAHLVGFSSTNSFYRSFRDYYGLPPIEWAEKQQMK